MGTVVRALEQGNRMGTRTLRDLGTEFREARLPLGLSQRRVAEAVRMSRVRYLHIEAGDATTLTVLEVNRIAAVLGLAASTRLYPTGAPIRDAAQTALLQRFLSLMAGPLTYRTEVPLPPSPDRRELRAWDAVISGHGARTAIEVEMRLRDIQALARRIALKRRDDPTEHFLLVVAGTRANRRVLDLLAEMLPDLPRLRARDVRIALEQGRHPGSGIVLF